MEEKVNRRALKDKPEQGDSLPFYSEQQRSPHTQYVKRARPQRWRIGESDPTHCMEALYSSHSATMVYMCSN